jgi:hypothetical protein
MKYFTYNLIPNSNEEEGGLIGPSLILKDYDNNIGIYDGEKYYGSANIDSLSIISEFNPVEISKELFDRYANPPPQITTRQFYMQAEKEGILTKQEVKDALVNKVIPSNIQSILNNISDPDQKFDAEMKLVSAIYFDRNNPLSEIIGNSFGKTTFQIDQFFRDASNL